MSSVHVVIAASGVRFGTSGARGLVADLSDSVCIAYTLAFIEAIGVPRGGSVALGMDLRPSSPALARACAAALRLAGLEVIFCGVLPTPALACFSMSQGVPAIMVTGSHIPFDRNGIKFYRPEGEITKRDETSIMTAIGGIPADPEIPPLPDVDDRAYRVYVERYLSFFPGRPLSGMRLGFYEHSSAGRDILGEILSGLGAEVVSLGRSDDFVPIDTEAVSAEDVARAREWSREGRFDALLSTDGDADRPLLGDEKGNWLRGDVVGILCAQALGASVVVTPVSSNTAVEKCGAFMRTIRTRIGSPYVITWMEALSGGKSANVVGFEANGGFLVGTLFVRDGRELKPLPTRDAVLPILVLLTEARRRGVPLSALPEGLPSRFTASNRIQQFPASESHRILRLLASSVDVQREWFGDLCGEPSTDDQTDGQRMIFDNDEILHLRPSGNAPELRCYAEADTQARADELVQACLDRVISKVRGREHWLSD